MDTLSIKRNETCIISRENEYIDIDDTIIILEPYSDLKIEINGTIVLTVGDYRDKRRLFICLSISDKELNYKISELIS